MTPSASAAPTTPASPPGPGEWDKWTHDQKLAWMKAGVLPKMRDLFATADPSKFADVTCKTCHGAGANDATFKMPNPDLPRLDPTPAGFDALAKAKPKMYDFMSKQVEPTTASLLGLPLYDMKTNAGFGCFDCHKKK